MPVDVLFELFMCLKCLRCSACLFVCLLVRAGLLGLRCVIFVVCVFACRCSRSVYRFVVFMGQIVCVCICLCFVCSAHWVELLGLFHASSCLIVCTWLFAWLVSVCWCGCSCVYVLALLSCVMCSFVNVVVYGFVSVLFELFMCTSACAGLVHVFV